jgi:uncharacterized cofD-like protein
LRRELDVAPPGDLRKCLVALAAPGSTWAAAFEHRFAAGELDGHALGNLVLVGLVDVLGDLTAALDEAGRVLEAIGRVRPATTEGVVLKADVEGGSVEGQVAVSRVAGHINHIELVPADAPAHPDAIAAIAAAHQVVLAPGSLYTSLLPVIAVPELREAVRVTPARVVQVCNLRPQPPETAGLDAIDHLRIVLEHDCRVDTFVSARDGSLSVDPAEATALGVEHVAADLAARNGAVHDPVRLAGVLCDLMES